ncbi:hypothetical protein Q4566_15020 [Tamlana sp. 2_MG-2023]|uniref:hypothetical protein n=1 Tax=unclassified Tamlana TaxID=2614803 RepID=UPI0026E2E0EE|nr:MULTISPECIES: hypothetical protein [unclassified Tamlana]MDO6761522.1 hypothetical protein [Tamlana sp. 2_MG-2023]MDO6792384.1 hypothetical protein [Tamlana sp. 1_MG-2023]
MKTYKIIFLSFSLLFLNCKKKANRIASSITKEIIIDSINAQTKTDTTNTTKESPKLIATRDFSKTLKALKSIKHTKNKHKDWVSDYSFVFSDLIELDSGLFQLKTTSYTYKKDCTFYLHTLSHLNDSISIKPFLEHAQGKTTEGYTQNRVLIFAMKNDKEANLIDIPEKLNPLKLIIELEETLYKNINSDVIECHRFNACVYRGLRLNKS